MISNVRKALLSLRQEIRRSEESRYDHRLHGVLLVAEGMSCPEAARLLGQAPRTVEYWVRAFERDGLGGLRERRRPGRPSLLTPRQLEQVSLTLQHPPEEAGLDSSVWDGRTLATLLESRFSVTLGIRQCQRLLRKLGFRSLKPRPAAPRATAPPVTKKQ